MMEALHLKDEGVMDSMMENASIWKTLCLYSANQLALYLSLSLLFSLSFFSSFFNGREESDKDRALNSDNGKQFFLFCSSFSYAVSEAMLLVVVVH